MTGPDGFPASSPRRFATRGLFSAAGRACDAHDRWDAVALADARTSACDWRAALNIALGRPLSVIDGLGLAPTSFLPVSAPLAAGGVSVVVSAGGASVGATANGGARKEVPNVESEAGLVVANTAPRVGVEVTPTQPQ